MKNKKRTFIIVLSMLSLFSSLRAVEIEGRVGFSLADMWGLHIGAYTRIPVSGSFAIQTGLLLHTSEWEGNARDNWNIGVNIPVYASFSLPMGESAKLRLNVGPYVGAGNSLRLGATGEAGVEWKRYYIGLACFQNCVNDQITQGNLSFGYRF